MAETHTKGRGADGKKERTSSSDDRKKEKLKQKKKDRRERKKRKRGQQQQQQQQQPIGSVSQKKSSGEINSEEKGGTGADQYSYATRKARKLSSEERTYPNETTEKLNIPGNKDISNTVNAAKSTSRHPFEVDEADHCETPRKAYQDILPVLSQIAQERGKSLKDLKIYDPYYCDGGVEQKLRSLGCQNVINVNRDFYKDIASDTVPDHDVLVTNPPYSGHHVESLLKFVSNNWTKTGKMKKQRLRTPFLLLLPHYVYTKPYFLDYFVSDARGIANPGTVDSSLPNSQQKLFYLIPKNNYRYSYEPPSWVSAEKGSTSLGKGKTQTAPFPSFWYCHVPSLMDDSAEPSSSSPQCWLTRTFGQSGSGHYVASNSSSKSGGSATLHYASCTSHIPREFKGEFDLTKKRPNPRARKRAAEKRQHPQLPQSSPVIAKPGQHEMTSSTAAVKRKKKKRY